MYFSSVFWKFTLLYSVFCINKDIFYNIFTFNIVNLKEKTLIT